MNRKVFWGLSVAVIGALGIGLGRLALTHENPSPVPVTSAPTATSNRHSSTGPDPYSILELETGMDRAHIDAFLAHMAELKYREGLSLLSGRPAESQLRRALQDFREAASVGNGQAAFEVGRMLEHGLGTQADPSGAFEAYLQAAKAGVPIADLKTAEMLRDGIGTQVDYASAGQWFERAAQAGEAPALEAIGRLYANGLGYPQDYKTALKYYKEAAKAGDLDGEASLGLAMIYGRGIPRNTADGLASLRQTASRGSVAAAVALSQLYTTGIKGAAPSRSTALYWLTQAAEKGDALSQRRLGERFARAPTTPEDLKRAVEWLAKASDNGDGEAAADLAILSGTIGKDPAAVRKMMNYAFTAARRGNPTGALLVAKFNSLHPSNAAADATVQHLVAVAALETDDWRCKYVEALIARGASFNTAVSKALAATQTDYLALAARAVSLRGSTVAVPVVTVNPKLTPEMTADAFSGTVNISVTVSMDGKPTAIAVMDAPNSQIKSAVIHAVNAWRFIPATKSGKAVQSTVHIPLKFNLD